MVETAAATVPRGNWRLGYAIGAYTATVATSFPGVIARSRLETQARPVAPPGAIEASQNELSVQPLLPSATSHRELDSATSDPPSIQPLASSRPRRPLGAVRRWRSAGGSPFAASATAVLHRSC